MSSLSILSFFFYSMPFFLLGIEGHLPENVRSIKNKEGVHGAISFCFRSKGTPMESLLKGS